MSCKHSKETTLRVWQEKGEKMANGMTNEQFKIVLEMIVKIIEKSETKEEAIEEIKKLTKNPAK